MTPTVLKHSIQNDSVRVPPTEACQIRTHKTGLSFPIMAVVSHLYQVYISLHFSQLNSIIVIILYVTSA